MNTNKTLGYLKCPNKEFVLKVDEVTRVHFVIVQCKDTTCTFISLQLCFYNALKSTVHQSNIIMEVSLMKIIVFSSTYSGSQELILLCVCVCASPCVNI